MKPSHQSSIACSSNVLLMKQAPKAVEVQSDRILGQSVNSECRDWILSRRLHLAKGLGGKAGRFESSKYLATSITGRHIKREPTGHQKTHVLHAGTWKLQESSFAPVFKGSILRGLAESTPGIFTAPLSQGNASVGETIKDIISAPGSHASHPLPKRHPMSASRVLKPRSSR